MARGFPGGSVDKNPPANPGDTGLIPGSGRSHMPWITKSMRHHYWACVLEPGDHNSWSLCTLEPMLHNKRSHCNEKPMKHNYRVASTHPS